ncbi:hypothetical protein Droror1_Dr00019752 [Drosera rotundifolia]
MCTDLQLQRIPNPPGHSTECLVERWCDQIRTSKLKIKRSEPFCFSLNLVPLIPLRVAISHLSHPCCASPSLKLLPCRRQSSPGSGHQSLSSLNSIPSKLDSPSLNQVSLDLALSILDIATTTTENETKRPDTEKVILDLFEMMMSSRSSRSISV